MRSVNKVILVGNLTRDPEMRQTANGQMVTTFCIATNREWITKDSDKHSLAEYHDIVAWARLAEICSKYLKKGKLVYIEGYLKTRSWDTPEGVRKFRTEVVAQDMIMLEKRPKGEEGEDYIPQVDEGGGMVAHNESAPEEAPKKEKPAEKPEPEAKEEEAPEEEPVEEKEEEKKEGGINIDADLGL
ncbi:single-stranded DNA-binding protein [Patescibacteria group bacterium]